MKLVHVHLYLSQIFRGGPLIPMTGLNTKIDDRCRDVRILRKKKIQHVNVMPQCFTDLHGRESRGKAQIPHRFL